MFVEFLEKNRMTELLDPVGKRTIFPSFKDRKKWSDLPEEMRDALVRWGNEALTGYPQLTATQYLAYSRTGDRKSFETPYFHRRTLLIGAVLAECVTGKGLYLDAVADGVWHLCEETSWVVSAHHTGPNGKRDHKHLLPDIQTPNIDLFSAQTAATLAYTDYLLPDSLKSITQALSRRIRTEVENRVLTPFMIRDDFWWMGFIRKDLNNWTPWIISNIMDAFLLLETDIKRLAAALERCMLILDRYLACVPEDGGCDEGCGYWNVAGASLLDCLESLYLVTDGKANFYNEPRIRAFAEFPLKAHIAGPWFWNFADCDAKPILDGERVYTFGIRTKNPQLATLGNEICKKQQSPILVDTPQMNRVLFSLFTQRKPVEANERETGIRIAALPRLQVWAMEKNGVYAAIKGGNNAESHNHNDIGNVLVYLHGEPALVDAGNMTYTAKTFSDDRYSLWNTRASYHNLPIIGNIEQQEGENSHADTFEIQDNRASVELQSAYPPETGLLRYRRELDVRKCAVITDELELRESSEITWVWMLRHKPEEFAANEGTTEMRAGNLLMRFSSALSYRWEEIPIEDERMARSFPDSLYRLLLTAKADTLHTERFEFGEGTNS